MPRAVCSRDSVTTYPHMLTCMQKPSAHEQADEHTSAHICLHKYTGIHPTHTCKSIIHTLYHIHMCTHPGPSYTCTIHTHKHTHTCTCAHSTYHIYTYTCSTHIYILHIHVVTYTTCTCTPHMSAHYIQIYRHMCRKFLKGILGSVVNSNPRLPIHPCLRDAS